MTAESIHKRLRALADPQKAAILQRFFKTGPGEYAEGDLFSGVRVPELRRLAREFRDLPLKEARVLLTSPIHEARLVALFIIIGLYGNADEKGRSRIYDVYLKSTRYVNNWDLVDASAHRIVGVHLENRSRRPLYKLARSGNLWERRIAVLATLHFIRQGEFAETLRVAEMLLDDEEDLIHKAVGWMLREVGKRHRKTEEDFLKSHYKRMPRTMLRYAIERLPESTRRRYLHGKV